MSNGSFHVVVICSHELFYHTNVIDVNIETDVPSVNYTSSMIE